MRWICFEGVEGTGKTTQCKKLAEYLTNKGYRVLLTKEPGTPHSPLTMKLREIMLSNEFDKELTIEARELISQAIRSIHLQKVVQPAIDAEYDFCIQDRGIISGLAYGKACGLDEESLVALIQIAVPQSFIDNGYYDDVVYLRGDVDAGLEMAKNTKQEFASGDAIESKGSDFMHRVANNFEEIISDATEDDVCIIDINGKNIDEVFEEIKTKLNV